MRGTIGVLAVCLSACAPVVSGVHHIKRGDAAVARGDIDTAHEAYLQAERERGDDAWTYRAIERGRARIKVEMMRRDPGITQGSAVGLHASRNELRRLGGDEALDRTLLAALQANARAEVEEAEEHLRARRLDAAMRPIRRILGVPDIDADLIARATAVQAGAAAVHDARAHAAGTQHPLAARAHRALAAGHRGIGIGDESELGAPYRRSIAVTTTGACDPFVGPVRAALETPRGPRHVDVEIQFTRCVADETATPSSEPVQWEEEVLDHYETRYTLRCQKVKKTVSLGGSGNCTYSGVGDRSVTQTCTPNTTEIEVEECFQDPYQHPVMRKETRKDTRTVTTTRWSVATAGTWTVRRDGQSKSGRFGGTREATAVTAPAIGKVAARNEGTQTSVLRLFEEVSPAVPVKVELDRVFQPDIDAAVAVARAAAAAGRIDEEEEAWMRIGVLGGDASKIAQWAERYGAWGAEPNALLASFTGPAVPERPPLAEVTVFDVPEEGPAKFSKRELDSLRARVVPTLSARFWFQGELAYVGLGTTTAPGQPELGGDVGGMFGLRGGGRVLTRKKKSPWGLQLIDEASAVAAIGTGGGAPMDVSGTSAVFQLEASYLLGVGYRGFGGGGLIVGLRPGAGLVRVTSGMPTYANVIPFARLELTRPKGAIAIEAMAASLVGTEQWGLNLHLGKGSTEPNDLGHFFSLRIERSVHDLDLRIPDIDPTEDPMVRAEDVALTTVSIMYGVGSQ